MKNYKFVRTIALSAFVVAISCVAFAQNETQADEKAMAEKAAMMQKMKALMSPSEAHKVLESLAGKWDYTSKFWMAADVKPEESTGTSLNEMIYGGRFLRQTATGTWQKEPWEGTGFTGYDNMRKEYQTVWIDGMSTGLMKSAGPYDAGTKTLTLSGTTSCPMTGETDHKMRLEWTLVDPDHNVMSGYGADPKTGKEMKGMEISYTRAQ